MLRPDGRQVRYSRQCPQLDSSIRHPWTKGYPRVRRRASPCRDPCPGQPLWAGTMPVPPSPHLDLRRSCPYLYTPSSALRVNSGSLAAAESGSAYA
eukprot:scaffold7095_cov386-Prasinococcus_capsulatus_cf.AAC.3